MAFVNTSQQQLPTPDTPDLMTDINTDTSTPASYANHSTTWTPTDGTTPALTTNPSRKRSRDETAFEDDSESSYFSHPSQAIVSTPAPIPEENEPDPEPIYGEGMVLLNPSTGQVLSAESQTGTWYEERATREADEHSQRKLAAEIAADEAAKQFRPKMPVSRKSIRMSQSSIRAEADPDVSALVTGLSSGAPASPPQSSSERPEADEATMALGIGWTKMASEDPELQAAARGWARYIDNHYRSIHSAEILLRSRSLNAYLVGSQEGFFLFSDDLLEAKLVGKQWETALQNLRVGQFEGTETVRAERTPEPEERKNSMLDFQRAQPQSIAVDGAGAGMDLD